MLSQGARGIKRCRYNVNAMRWRRIDVDTTSFWHQVSAGLLYADVILTYIQVERHSYIQSNFNGSNIFGTMEISSRQGVVRANEGWL